MKYEVELSNGDVLWSDDVTLDVNGTLEVVIFITPPDSTRGVDQHTVYSPYAWRRVRWSE